MYTTYRSCIWWLNTCRCQLPKPGGAKEREYKTNTRVNQWPSFYSNAGSSAGNDSSAISKSKGSEVPICYSDLEIGRHEGIVYDHHYVFVLFVDQLRAGPDVDDLHSGVGGCLDPHQLHQERDVDIWLHRVEEWYGKRCGKRQSTHNLLIHNDCF